MGGKWVCRRRRILKNKNSDRVGRVGEKLSWSVLLLCPDDGFLLAPFGHLWYIFEMGSEPVRLLGSC